MEELKKIKIKIINKEHSEAVQKALFALGCNWGNNGQKISNTHAKSLSVWNRMDIGYGTKWGDTIMQDFKEVTVTDLYKYMEEFRSFSVNLGTYTAIIKKNSVTVGCQNIPNERIRTFIETYNKAHKK